MHNYNNGSWRHLWSGAREPFFNRGQRSKITFYRVRCNTWYVRLHPATWNRPPILIQDPGRELTRSCICYAVCECWHMVSNSNVLKSDRWVIAITLTPVRHKRHMQFLTSAPNFRRVSSLSPLTRPSESLLLIVSAAVTWNSILSLLTNYNEL